MGHDIHRVTSTDTTDATIPAALILGGQHSNEPAGRERGMRRTQDLAFTDDPAWVDLLGRARLVVIPSREGVARLAEVCAQHDVTLIHVSTDYVFDGAKHTPYTECDALHPVNT